MKEIEIILVQRGIKTNSNEIIGSRKIIRIKVCDQS